MPRTRPDGHAGDQPGQAVVQWVSDCCLRVDLTGADLEHTRARVRACADAFAASRMPRLVDVTPAWATVLLTFAGGELDETAAEEMVRGILARLETHTDTPAPARTVDIAVCYEGACALDLAAVAQACHLTPQAVIDLHAGASYRVSFLGFAPGFPYLDGLAPSLAVPRLVPPRPRVPWGSVAIAGNQAGIYPHASAGGWRILGRTPLRLFDGMRAEPALLRLGDVVRFVPITHAEHLARAAMPLG